MQFKKWKRLYWLGINDEEKSKPIATEIVQYNGVSRFRVSSIVDREEYRRSESDAGAMQRICTCLCLLIEGGTV